MLDPIPSNNHFIYILEQWVSKKDCMNWTLATIIKTHGSTYRKAGAQILINDLGQSYGVLSGGCIEKDIINKARLCWEDNLNTIIEYQSPIEDAEYEEGFGLGCGGKLLVLLQPVNKANHYLHLEELLLALKSGAECRYQLNTRHHQCPNNKLEISTMRGVENVSIGSGDDLLEIKYRPPFNLVIFGSGVDVQPIINLANNLGWYVFLASEKLTPTMQSQFYGKYKIIVDPFKDSHWLKQIDAAVIMNHSLHLDTKAVCFLNNSFDSISYVGILGPLQRTDRVLTLAEYKNGGGKRKIHSPIGLKLGGDTPETIALSIISEVQMSLNNRCRGSL